MKLVGERAKMATHSIRFPKKEIVDVEGFVEGIWLLWISLARVLELFMQWLR